MKAIIQAYSPEEVGRIARGEQTIKVCKTAPKETPFKVYMYCTTEKIGRGYLHTSNHKDRLYVWSNPDDTEIRVEPDGYTYTAYSCRGKVVGDYVCERVTEHEICDSGAVVNYWAEGLQHSCLTISQIDEYVGKRSPADYYKKSKISALHIPAVKFYDKPKDLGDFVKNCPIKNRNCVGCEFYSDYSGSCKNYVTRPPRGWQYVEED